MKTEELDQNMRLVKPESEDGICWYTPGDAPFLVEGFAFFQQEHRYCRLPCELLPKLRDMGRPAVADLGWHTAGGQIQYGKALCESRFKQPVRYAQYDDTGAGRI